MKKIISILLVLIPIVISAQNIQLHYDLGKQEDGIERNFFVSTFEFFNPDTLGYTFLFTDFEFNSPDNPRGISLGYFEIARTFNLGWLGKSQVLNQLMIHTEYNDGSVIYYPMDNDSTLTGENLRGSWLGGLEYGFNIGDLSLNAMVLYKYIRGSSAPDAQFTLAWFYPLFQNKISLSGFLDVWTQDNFYGNPDEKVTVLYAEPQIWYNINNHLSAGTELKISKNFVFGSERVEVFPTVGVKWEF